MTAWKYGLIGEKSINILCTLISYSIFPFKKGIKYLGEGNLEWFYHSFH